MSGNTNHTKEVNNITSNGERIPDEEAAINEKDPMMKEKDDEEEDYEDEVFEDLPLSEDTKCGLWCIQSSFLQRFANKKAYALLYGVLGSVFSASYAYSNATITTIEKRFKIPSRNSGIITVGNDISQVFTSLFLSYYAGRGHRPRWVAFGMYTVVLYCFLTALPHFLYGSGEDSLMLTTEYGASPDNTTSLKVLEKYKRQTLCDSRNGTLCELEEGNLAPQLILFSAQLVSGVGGSLYYTLGTSYMDDNIKKSKTPAVISFSYFVRMLGPACGYALASFCLKIYISPTLTPTINTSDPRWLGAWWLGWGLLGVILFGFASLLALFPKTLPRQAVRNAARLKSQKSETGECEPERAASFRDMIQTFKRLICNNILMFNNLSTVFYLLGYMPYWIFMPKYIETQYRQSAAASSLITGVLGLMFSALGILISGVVIGKYTPRARYLAAWNVIIGFISVMGIASYAYLGCAENNNQAPLLKSGELQTNFQCNSECYCDYVKYSPVCSQDGHTNFISACHAGCTTEHVFPNGSKIFTNCKCINANVQSAVMEKLVSPLHTEGVNSTSSDSASIFEGGFAVPGNCPVDCSQKFYIFLAVVCLMKFSGASGRLSNFLVSVRCVEEQDKAVAMGLGLMIMSLCAFIPSPILFGVILDKACMVWGKTCSGTGNCWLYNGETLRYTMNFTAASFVFIGTMFDAGVWYYVKDINIFDEDSDDEDDKKTKSKTVEQQNEKNKKNGTNEKMELEIRENKEETK